MIWIGLTGGIACGKSAVAEYLRSNGWDVVDADVIAHQALSRGESSYSDVVKEFGPSILNSDKGIDRKTLGAIVFKDKTKLNALERIVHPWVQTQVKTKRSALEKAGKTMAFYDVPLLYEKNLVGQFHQTIVVACDEKLQIKRLNKRNGFTEDEARRRIAAQWPLAEKIKKADHVIYNNGTLSDLHKAVDAVLAKISK
jgi:dephospho-CoA kinase